MTFPVAIALWICMVVALACVGLTAWASLRTRGGFRRAWVLMFFCVICWSGQRGVAFYGPHPNDIVQYVGLGLLVLAALLFSFSIAWFAFATAAISKERGG